MGDALLRGIRGHLDLAGDELLISNFYGGLQVLNEMPPLRNVGLNDEGQLYADLDIAGASKEDVFDALRPGARSQVREVAERSIILRAKRYGGGQKARSRRRFRLNGVASSRVWNGTAGAR